MGQRKYTLFETKLGVCGIAWKEGDDYRNGVAVIAFQLPDLSDKATAKNIVAKTSAVEAKKIPPPIEAIIEMVQRHLAGEVQDFKNIEIDLDDAGPFAKTVYDAARKIPSGGIMTYGELAQKAMHPKAARAVGQAMARNPVPLIIPCHRVVAAGKKPGGYTAPGGIATKAKILAVEGAAVKSDWISATAKTN
jgi:methylated-DNA-[protein]-cysteine S-methyltransferase